MTLPLRCSPSSPLPPVMMSSIINTEPFPIAEPELMPIPSTKPVPAALSVLEPKQSDQVCETVLTSVPVEILVELDEEVNCYHHHPPALESSSVSQSEIIDVLVSFCSQCLPPPLAQVSFKSPMLASSKSSSSLMVSPCFPIPPSVPVQCWPGGNSKTLCLSRVSLGSCF